ncbi:MAG: hypothetical protein IPK82_14095 [Polyangiaceae bacterium]|nr:hypothetical protein [Polyangiaceae bacterium]
MRTIRSFLLPVVTALSLLAGCGGAAGDATSKELAALTAEISRLRADQAALGERLEALERSKARPLPATISESPATSGAPTAAPTLDSDRPALDVVRLGPSADTSDDADSDIDSGGPRTVLRSGANGIVVEETTADGTTRPVDSGSTKKASTKKADKADRKKTASLPTP